jgi:glycerol-3-phosphate dehydrogenase
MNDLFAQLILWKVKHMNADQIGGIVRALLAAASGWAVGHGYLDNNTALALSGAVVTIATAVWSFYTNKPGTVIPPKTGA